MIKSRSRAFQAATQWLASCRASSLVIAVFRVAGSLPWLERYTGAQLDLPPRRHCAGDGAEAGGVHEAVGHIVVHLIQRVEKLAACLQFQPLGQGEGAHDCGIERLHAGTIDGVASGVAKGIRRRSRKGARIEPLARSARALREYLLPG